MDHQSTAFKSVFSRYFKKLFHPRSRVLRLRLKEVDPVCIPFEEAKSLISPFTMMEIEVALHDLDSNKAPGPNGLNGAFIKKVWEFLKEDFMLMISKFQNFGFLPKGMNFSFITLIPKVKFPQKTSEFRPISLINFTMKILLKVLTNKLSLVLLKIISDHQSAFIKN